MGVAWEVDLGQTTELTAVVMYCIGGWVVIGIHGGFTSSTAMAAT